MSLQSIEKIILIAGALAAVVQASIMCKQVIDANAVASAHPSTQSLQTEIPK
jgi:hypothetical protein